MTAPTDSARGVDVDAILAREIERAGGSEYIVGRQLIAARKAIAELIAADKAYDDAWDALVNADDAARPAAEALVEAAFNRRKAALAKVTP